MTQGNVSRQSYDELAAAFEIEKAERAKMRDDLEAMKEHISDLRLELEEVQGAADSAYRKASEAKDAAGEAWRRAGTR
ncbi:hypothetical protein ACQ5SP_06680 [Rhodovulum sp. YNF3179]|uniref:hypothetical protein n=1 Tax=Rhodovulum sp. YNF3179 TaxID=3425127 RepID=UPI003D334604